MRANNEAALAWAKRCRGGGEEAGASEGVDENDGGIGSKRGVVFFRQSMYGRYIIDRQTG